MATFDPTPFAEIIPADHFQSQMASGKSLRIKFGADPSAPDLHLGHMVALRRLREFQDLGHQVIFLIGDFTARIGDPTGKSETRKPLDPATIQKNADTYQAQVFLILDRSRTEVVHNSTWLDPLTAADLIQLAAKQTVARMLERDDFHKRFKGEQPIAIHEFMYPLLQGYDSVVLKNDVELGGTDQKFNLLMGRHLQKEWGQVPQSILTVPILEGLDGIQKMSKSLGNHIALLDPPNEMYGKLMSIPDRLIEKYLTLISSFSREKRAELIAALQASSTNPRTIKDALAQNIVTQLHSESNAIAAANHFVRVFSNKEPPDDAPEIQVTENLALDEFLTRHELAPSKKEAQRLITAGAVSINGDVQNDSKALLFTLISGEMATLKVGKRRFARLVR